MGLLHVASSPLNSSAVFTITRLFFVLMNKEFLYCSVLECSTTTARVFITKDYKSREEGSMTKMLRLRST
jgi:hypothetical protein